MITVIIGTVSMLTLPTSQYPDIVPPEIQVQAIYPGADAKTLSQAVSTPIEQQMNGVDNMLYMYSVNANNGQATVYVDFDVKTNSDTDQVLSQLRVSQAQAQLPAQVNAAGVTVLKSLTSPLMVIGLSSPGNKFGADFLTNYAIINLQDELTRVPGVSRVQIFGGQYALRVWVKPDQLAKLGVTATEIISALQTQNNVNPAGKIGGEPVPSGQQFTYTVRTQGRLVTPEEFEKIVIRANPDGSVLHLRDVARVELGTQVYDLTARYNGAPAGILAVYQLPGSNAVATAEGVNKRLKELSANFPAGMKYDVPLDTTKAVTAGIHEIIFTLGSALVLVIIVVYVFLQGWRATLIPLMAVPVSLIGTFILFPLLGFFHQHPFAFRIGAGDRPRCRRCHHRGGSCGAPHRPGDESPRSNHQGDGAGGGAGGGDRADPRRSVHSDGGGPGHHRPAIPAVRDHDRSLGIDFGL